mmetsp:Transcript_30944/g.100779  ORF Transcript_30944/g.100779 Transcript_30944/m.100779 type:complete len:223 (+) Transcript_30944:427-1095(+)
MVLSSVAKRPAEMTPHAPAKKCTGDASRTSSICILRSILAERYSTMPPMMPMKTAAYASTTAHGAVMETRPARMPLSAGPMSRWLPHAMLRRMAAVPPEPAASVVVTATFCAMPMHPRRQSVETGLKPYQPNQRIMVPSAWSTVLCPGMSSATPSAVKRPVRGWRKMAPMSAAPPPVMCTMPEPAKSMSPCAPSAGSYSPASLVRNAESQPSADQPQCTATG